MSKEKIIEKYKKEINDLYKFKGDNEACHIERDGLMLKFIKEIEYEEIALLFEKIEDDIGFWYS